MANIRGLFKNVAYVTMVSIITRLFAFVFKIYISRKLGAEILGVYQITMSIFILFVSLPASGIPVATSRHVAGLIAKGKEDKAYGITTSALLISSGLSTIIIVLCYAFPNVTSLLFKDARCNKMFRIMLPALLSTSIYAIIRSYFQGSKNFRIYSTSELISEVLSIVIIMTILALSIFNDISHGIAIAFVISDYVVTIVLVILYFTHGGKLRRPTMLKELTSSCVPITSTRILGSSISSLIALILPILLVKYGMSSQDAMASYGRASGMVMPLILIPATIIVGLLVVIIPDLASMHAKGKNLSTAISSAINFSLLVACFFLVIFMSVGDRICSFLFDDKIAGEYMILSCILVLPMSLNQTLVSTINTLGHENATFKTHIIGSIILSVLIVILPKHMGIYAYFVGLFIFHTITCIIYICTLRKLVSLDKNILKSSIMLIIFALTLGIMLKLVTKHILSDFLSIIICSIISLLIYGIGIVKLRFIDVNILKTNLKKR